MLQLPLPQDENGIPFVPVKVFDLCISQIRDARLKARLLRIRNLIASAAADYDVAATAARLWELPAQTHVGLVTAREMMDVYSLRMVPKTQPGRPVYDKILNSPKHGRCPLCDVGTANTLDHHLPKSSYPALAVTPNNLVPSCQWCQSAKMDAGAASAGDQTFHPYFENFQSAVWLHAAVVEGVPAAFEFSVHAPSNWNTTVVQRLNSHLSTFKLPQLYSSNAGSVLAGIRSRLAKLLGTGGAEAVRNHLQEEVESWEKESTNSWEAAMYRAAVSSDWFCAGGFAGR